MKKIILLISLISLVGSNLLFAAYRQSDSKNPLINLISTLEHNYFDITENLLNEELEANFELSRLKILLNSIMTNLLNGSVMTKHHLNIYLKIHWI